MRHHPDGLGGISKPNVQYTMNPHLLLFIKPIDFHYGIELSFPPIILQQNKTTIDKDDTIGHNASTIKWQNIPTQHNTANTKQRKHTYLTIHYKTPDEKNKIQCNTTEDKTKNTNRYDTVRCEHCLSKCFAYQIFLKNFSYFHEIESENVWPFCPIFSRVWRIWGIEKTNLFPNSCLISRIWLFREFETRKEFTYLSICGYFLKFHARRAWTYCLSFDCNHEFETRKGWTY